MMRSFRHYCRPVVPFWAAVFLLIASAQAGWAASDAFQIKALSNRPDKVSGGEVLVRIDVPENLSGDRLLDIAAVKLNGNDVTRLFRAATEPHAFIGLIADLKLGQNLLQLFRNDVAVSSTQLAITNFPLSGPVFSGPHQQPFVCQTAEFILPNGRSLGAPLDVNCSIRTVVTYIYRSAESQPSAPWKLLADRSVLPSDVAMTTTSSGQTVPYIVRVETGTLNRAIYQIAVLHNPVSEPAPEPFAPMKGWNRRLLYSFGGGCTGGWFRQGATTGLSLNTASQGTLTDAVLRAGYAYASATLNVFGNNCQDVTAAETMMMVKEHFIETYGVPLFTFGRGGSGGAYQQIQIADNYPGLLDGIIPSATFPDVMATVQFLTDTQLLNAYYTKISNALTDEQKRAIAGVGVLPSVTRVSSGAGRINPRVFCPPELPEALRYHPVSNPKGARCDVFDHTVNVYGRDPATGFARRPLDNTGVQYGLAALHAGLITPAQFLDLNEKIGGYDNDGNIVAARSVADPVALRAAYTTGRVTNAGGGLASVPIIDLRGYLDLQADGDVHLKYHSFSFRERLVRANGTSANQVLIVSTPGTAGLEEYTITKMDEWLTNLAQDRTTDRTLDKIVRAKPADLVDSCLSPTRERITETQTSNGGTCNTLYPAFPPPRMMAGGPPANDVLKCQLKPIDFSEYRVTLSAADKSRLSTVFPSGVCDWTKPGVAQQKLADVWLSY